MKLFMIILFAYLLGSIPTGLIIGRVVAGKDIRLWGSGNIGASNVGRTIGRKWGLLTFIGDFLKGLIPVLIARYFLGLEMFFICLVGVVAVLGHIFSVFLRFKGGKGVATAGGAFFAISPVALFIALIVYALVAGFTHISSLGSLLGALSLVAVMIFIGEPLVKIAFAFLILLLLIYTHIENIKRLISGEENRI